MALFKPQVHIPKHGQKPGEYRDTKTDAARHFYNSPIWRRKSKQHRAEEPFCRECKKEGRVKLGDMVDHIIQMSVGGAPFEDDNLQTLCHHHHNIKRKEESRPLVQQ